MYTLAGHPPPAVYRTADTVEFLEGGDLPVSLIAGYEYHEQRNRLSPGDKLLLYTDGITEARTGLEMFGMEGIERALKEHGRRSPTDVAGELLAMATAYGGARLRDDAAIVVIERVVGQDGVA